MIAAVCSSLPTHDLKELGWVDMASWVIAELTLECVWIVCSSVHAKLYLSNSIFWLFLYILYSICKCNLYCDCEENVVTANFKYLKPFGPFFCQKVWSLRFQWKWQLHYLIQDHGWTPKHPQIHVFLVHFRQWHKHKRSSQQNRLGEKRQVSSKE